MNTINHYKNRFYNLLESTIGDVKPLTEQSSSKSRPGVFKIHDNGFEGSYEGVEFDPTGIAHKFSNTASDAVGKKLKELYSQKKYSKVDLDNIEMSTEGMGKEEYPGYVIYKLKIPIVRVNNPCDDYTSFDRRGGWGHGSGTKRNDLVKELSNEPTPGTSLDISKEYKTEEGLVEYFAQWKNKNYQSKCGSSSQPTTNTTSSKTSVEILHEDDPEIFRKKLKALYVVYNPTITKRTGGVLVSYDKTGDKPVSLSFIYSPSGEKDDVLDKVRETYPNLTEIPYSVGLNVGYIVTGKQIGRAHV